LTFEDLIVQKLPATPLFPEQSFVAWNAFVTRFERSCDEAGDAEKARAASEKTAAATARMPAGDLIRPTIGASFARGASVPGICAACNFLAAEVAFPMSGAHIFPDPLALPRYRSRKTMIVVGGRNHQGASIPN
jgi:hypothetical protein